MPEQSTLYDRVGGEAAISRIVDDYYQRILGDPELAPFFARVPLDRLKSHQIRFMTQLMGGPQSYEGRDMQRAHAGMGIEPRHFGRVAGHLAEALRHNGVAEDSVQEVLTAIAPVGDDVLRSEK